MSHLSSSVTVGHRRAPDEDADEGIGKGDLLVDSRVVLEIKAVERILPVHRAQLVTYLKLSGIATGLLLNFNAAHMRDGIHRRVAGAF